MPGLTTLTQQGAFTADLENAINTNLANTPGIVASVNLATQAYGVFNTAAAVNLLAAAAPAGTYRVSIYLIITTSFSTNTEVTLTIGWTDDDTAQTVTYTTGAKTAGTTLVGSQLLRSTGAAAVTYTPNVTGSAATAGAASFSVVLERLI